MRSLQSMSYEIRTRHEESRRNILFDDDEMDLVLDFSIGGGPWRRVTAMQARSKSKRGGLSSKTTVDDMELDEILDKSKLEERDDVRASTARRPRKGFGGDQDNSE